MGLQADSALSRRTAQTKSVEVGSPTEKGLASRDELAEISVTGTNIGSLNRSPRPAERESQQCKAHYNASRFPSKALPEKLRTSFAQKFKRLKQARPLEQAALRASLPKPALQLQLVMSSTDSDPDPLPISAEQ